MRENRFEILSERSTTFWKGVKNAGRSYFQTCKVIKDNHTNPDVLFSASDRLSDPNPAKDWDAFPSSNILGPSGS